MSNFFTEEQESRWAEDRYRSKYESLSPIQRKNNPNAEPMGHFTGRCKHCGSSDLWDDNLHYGCNSCGAFLM